MYKFAQSYQYGNIVLYVIQQILLSGLLCRLKLHPYDDKNVCSRRATQLIGRQLAQIGDDLNSRWREKLPQQQHLDWQVYPNILIWRAFNR